MVTDNEDKQVDPNNETVEEGIEMLIEKLNFLLEQRNQLQSSWLLYTVYLYIIHLRDINYKYIKERQHDK